MDHPAQSSSGRAGARSHCGVAPSGSTQSRLYRETRHRQSRYRGQTFKENYQLSFSLNVSFIIGSQGRQRIGNTRLELQSNAVLLYTSTVTYCMYT